MWALVRKWGIYLLVEGVTPFIALWAWWQERRILRNGLPLNPRQLADAALLKIAAPERVRILVVREVPLPIPRWARSMASRFRFACPCPAGMTLGRGIFIVEGVEEDRTLVTHECVHVRQFAELGGLYPFLRRYLRECLLVGYDSSPLELEARRLEF